MSINSVHHIGSRVHFLKSICPADVLECTGLVLITQAGTFLVPCYGILARYVIMALPSRSQPQTSPRVDSQELLLCDDPNTVCETYIFEPSAGEEKLGYLFAAAEVEDRGGVGRELVEVVMAAIQNEYFRDRERSAIHSFELALHQANLILHDAAERGVRDWMGYFHVAVGALANKQLHVSVAGGGNVWLARRGMISCVSEGLSHLPITNPLRTFSQVASGEVTVRDVMFFATGNFPALFHPDDVARFTIDHSADTVTTRLQQLYRDQQQRVPVAIVTTSLLPEYILQPREEVATSFRPRATAAVTSDQLKPRKPLTIHRTGWQRGVLMAGQGLLLFGNWLKSKIWPHVYRGGAALTRQVGESGSKLLQVAGKQGQGLVASAGQSVRGVVTQSNGLPSSLKKRGHAYLSGVKGMKTWPSRFWGWLRNLPLTSKLFGVAAVVLLVVLLASLQLLQQKRASDAEIQQAAEMLHEAQTKKDAAVTALIYDNRDQATTLLTEAAQAAQEVEATGFYANEVAQLKTDIQTQQDRLQKITRVGGGEATVLGDFAAQLDGASATNLFFTADALYTFNPTSNAIVAMTAGGEVSLVSEQTKEIGFFRDGVSHSADKTLVLTTSDPGIAQFDTKDNSLRRQEIALAAKETAPGPIAVFGNRLYLYDPSIHNILAFNKTLRGFAGGTPWITDTAVPADSIRSFAVDGNIFTLHTDGSIRRLFKGAAADLTLDSVQPSLQGATKIFTNEDLAHMYVLDPAHKRVVVFTKKGGLVRQIFFADAADLKDMTIDGKETILYALDGTKVVKVPLIEATPAPTSPTP